MTRVLGRRRLLLSAVAEGAGLDAMFRLMGREIGAECWLLTATGRVVGGTGPSLPGPLALRLAGEYLRADRLPAAVRVSGPQIPAAGDGKYSLFAVGGEPRITSWFLACAGHEQDWGPWPTSCANPSPSWPRTRPWSGPGWMPGGPVTASWPRRSSPCSRRRAAREPPRPRSPR